MGVTYLRPMESNAGVGDRDRAAVQHRRRQRRMTDDPSIIMMIDLQNRTKSARASYVICILSAAISC